MKIEVKVNTDELRGERTRQKKSVQYMANLIGKHYSSYSKKENGECSGCSHKCGGSFGKTQT